MSLFRAFLFAVLVVNLWSIGCAWAQADIPAERQNRPPVAAPTSVIAVTPIDVVRSRSEQIEDFASGLIEGLMVAEKGVRGVALLAVEGDHVIVERYFGSSGVRIAYDIGSMSDFFAALAAMREIERSRLAPNEDVATALGNANPRDMTVGQVLAHQAGSASVLTALVEKASGQTLSDDIAANIFAPLAMNASSASPDAIHVTASDVAHVLMALLNGGAYRGTSILEPSTVALMSRTAYSPHQAVPGWTYGFKEMWRNGWRALERDGMSSTSQVRIVVVPEAALAYFVAVEGEATPEFWRVLDNGIFDRTFPPKAREEQLRGTPAPSAQEAAAVEGLYEPEGSYADSVAPLKLRGLRLRVRAGTNGSLFLSGIANATLTPQMGGYWRSADGNVVAARSGGRFVTGAGIFRPVPLWRLPLPYAATALLAALAGIGFAIFEGRRRREKGFPGPLVAASASLTLVFVFISLLVWLISPAA